MAKNAGWTDSLMWCVATARNALRRAMIQSEAARTLAKHSRITTECERLERRREALVHSARNLSDGDCAQRDALTQHILRYYSEMGELDRAIERATDL